MRRRGILSALLATLCGFAVAAGAEVPPRTIAVGSEIDYPPFALGRTSAEASGFTVELLRAVAREVGLEPRVKVAPFHEILDEFKAGEIEVMLNLAISDERRAFCDFSVPHVTMGPAIFVRQRDRRIQSEADLAGKSVIVLRDDLLHRYALTQPWGRHLVATDSAAEAVRLLASGKHDALVIGKLVGLQSMRDLRIERIEPVGRVGAATQKFAFAVRKGNAELLAQLNEGLALVKANGTYDKLYEKWFGVLEPRRVSFAEVARYVWPAALVSALILVAMVRQRRLLERLAETTRTLRVNEAKLAEAQRMAMLGSFVIEYTAGRIDCSVEAARILGRESKMLVDFGDYLQHVHDADRPRFEGLVATAARDGTPFNTDLRVSTVALQARWINARGERAGHTSRGEAVVHGTVMDITEAKRHDEERACLNVELQRRSQELAQKNAEMESLLYTVSHDLGAPLANMQGFIREIEVCHQRLGAWLEGIAPGPERDAGHALLHGEIPENLRYLAAGAQKFERLTAALLQLARYGKQELRIEYVNVNALVDATLDTLSQSIAQRKAEVSVGELPFAHADATTLGQVFANLIVNALNYLNPERAGRIEIGGERAAGEIRVWVRDNGLGIPADEQVKLFRVFQRFRPKLAPGEGIGLAIVKRIIELHRGRVWAESQEGEGTCIYFSLPEVP